MTVLEKIEKNYKENKDKLACVSQTGSLTFGELWEQSDNLAAWIQVNCNDENPIIVYGHKSEMMLACFIACAKAGHPYCPIDTSMPSERVQDIIEIIGNPLVFATEEFETEKTKTQIKGNKKTQNTKLDYNLVSQIISKAEILEIAKKTENKFKPTAYNPQRTYYIIFTSGSTGKPKGVEITHDNLKNFTDWSAKLFETPANMMNQAPLSFDLSVMDTYTALTSGHTLYLLPKQLQKEVPDTLAFIKEHRITYIVSTPSFANMLLSDKNFCEKDYQDIKQFTFCGETLTKRTAQALMERFPEAKVINTYGPTESTVAVTGIEITPEHLESEKELPIGIAKPGTEILIENEEIIIAGDTVAKGYYKEPEKTEQVFYTREETPKRCYKTGDKGFFDGGVLYYNGRIDNQIKLHGYRIELGDIEANLIDIEGIKDAAVLPRIKDGQIRSLTAFVVGNIEAESEYLAGKVVKSLLAEKLPEYMVPKKIKFIDKMPLTQNSKIDRKKLMELI